MLGILDDMNKSRLGPCDIIEGFDAVNIPHYRE